MIKRRLVNRERSESSRRRSATRVFSGGSFYTYIAVCFLLAFLFSSSAYAATGGTQTTVIASQSTCAATEQECQALITHVSQSTVRPQPTGIPTCAATEQECQALITPPKTPATQSKRPSVDPSTRSEGPPTAVPAGGGGQAHSSSSSFAWLAIILLALGLLAMATGLIVFQRRRVHSS